MSHATLAHPPYHSWPRELPAQVVTVFSTSPPLGALRKAPLVLLVLPVQHPRALQRLLRRECIGNDSLALHQFHVALRQWCRHLLGLPARLPSLQSTGVVFAIPASAFWRTSHVQGKSSPLLLLSSVRHWLSRDLCTRFIKSRSSKA